MPPDGACLPLILSARMRAWWLLWQARRNPLRTVVAVVAVVVVVAGLVVAGFCGPARGCSFRPAAVPGRAHWVCAKRSGHGT